LIIGSCDLYAKLGDVEMFDLLCTTVGFSVKNRIPIGPNVTGLVNFDQVTPLVVKDQTGNDSFVNARSTTEVGIALNPKVSWIYIWAGYRYRTFQMTSADTVYNEMQTGPFLSLQIAINQ
jgi:hypothetical protein